MGNENMAYIVILPVSFSMSMSAEEIGREVRDQTMTRANKNLAIYNKKTERTMLKTLLAHLIENYCDGHGCAISILGEERSGITEELARLQQAMGEER